MKFGATVGIAAAFLTIGFVMGRATAPTPTPGDGRPVAQRGSSSEPSGVLESDPHVSIEGASTSMTQAVAMVGEELERPAVSAGPGGASDAGAPEDGPMDPVTAAQEPDYDRAMELLALVEVALENGDAEALQALAEPLAFQAEFVVPELAALLEDAESLFAKENLAQLLGATQDAAALPVIQDLLEREENEAVRTAAIRALGQIPDPSSVPLLEAEFSRASDSPMPPSLAASSLGKIGTTDAVAALQKEVKQGTNRMVQSFALRALAELKDPGLIPFFLEQAQRKEGASERFRKSAIDAIAQTGDETAIRQLEQIVTAREESQSVRESAMRAINQLAGEAIYDIR